MDPQATWSELIEAWRSCDWKVVVELAEALLEWLRRDGFPPETMGTGLGGDWNREVAMAVCEFASRRANNVLNSAYQIPFDVPFVVSCALCGNEGPSKLEAAIAEGWRNLRYTPSGLSENFLGHCPVCQTAEDQA